MTKILLIIGNANWDIYLMPDNTCKAIAKPCAVLKGCLDSHFGDIGYIDKMINQRGFDCLGQFTSDGLKAIELNKNRQGYSNLKYSYLQKTNPIDFYTILNDQKAVI